MIFMTENPHRCVIDCDGYYVTFVNLDDLPKSFAITDGQSYIEASPPSNMIAPHWTGDAWEETASPEEIAAAEAVKAQEAGTVSEGAVLPSLAERVEAVEDALLALALGGGIGV